jgi:hypothetical protein
LKIDGLTYPRVRAWHPLLHAVLRRAGVPFEDVLSVDVPGYHGTVYITALDSRHGSLICGECDQIRHRYEHVDLDDELIALLPAARRHLPVPEPARRP